MEIRTRKDYYKETEYFSLFNPNPTQENRATKGDCVIRAFAIAGDLTWIESFDLLVANARKTYNVPNDQENYTQVFKEFGFVAKSVKVVRGQKRMTVEAFCKAHRKGSFILRIANHLTAVVNGKCYDAWNPANKCVYKYFELT